MPNSAKSSADLAPIITQAPDALLQEHFPTQWQGYLDWLLAQKAISNQRPQFFKDEAEFISCKQALEKRLGMSFDVFIQGLQINRLLRSRPQQKLALNYAMLTTPIGMMLALFSDKGLCLLEFVDTKALLSEVKALLKAFPQYGINAIIALQLQQQLDQYFAGERQRFDIALDMIGTAFQQKIWQILLSIPYGETLTYKAQAERYGNPAAVRAVANANGQNRISVIIPCHRVIGSNGSLTGYGGGLSRKQYLLNLEQKAKS